MKATDSDWDNRGISRVCFDTRGNGDTRLNCQLNKDDNGKKRPGKNIISVGWVVWRNSHNFDFG